MKTFTPAASNYFSRIPKGDVIKAISEATGKPVAPATGKMKRTESRRLRRTRP